MIKVNFDGACGPMNPGGKCGGGAVIIKDNVLLTEIAERYKPDITDLKATSNNVGEYYGLIKAMEYLIDNGLASERIEVYGDSNLVINQMSGRWKIKNGIYKDIAKQAIELKSKFTNVAFFWIPRGDNEWADVLSKEAIAKNIVYTV